MNKTYSINDLNTYQKKALKLLSYMEDYGYIIDFTIYTDDKGYFTDAYFYFSKDDKIVFNKNGTINKNVYSGEHFGSNKYTNSVSNDEAYIIAEIICKLLNLPKEKFAVIAPEKTYDNEGKQTTLPSHVVSYFYEEDDAYNLTQNKHKDGEDWAVYNANDPYVKNVEQKYIEYLNSFKLNKATPKQVSKIIERFIKHDGVYGVR